LVCAASASAKWHMQANFQVSPKQAGKSNTP
jgi:hypothetical protein